MTLFYTTQKESLKTTMNVLNIVCTFLESFILLLPHSGSLDTILIEWVWGNVYRCSLEKLITMKVELMKAHFLT